MRQVERPAVFLWTLREAESRNRRKPSRDDGKELGKMDREKLFEALSKVDMRIEAQLALVSKKQFALAGQWSRRMRHSTEEWIKVEQRRREFVAKRS